MVCYCILSTRTGDLGGSANSVNQPHPKPAPALPAGQEHPKRGQPSPTVPAHVVGGRPAPPLPAEAASTDKKPPAAAAASTAAAAPKNEIQEMYEDPDTVRGYHAKILDKQLQQQQAISASTASVASSAPKAAARKVVDEPPPPRVESIYETVNPAEAPPTVPDRNKQTGNSSAAAVEGGPVGEATKVTARPAPAAAVPASSTAAPSVAPKVVPRTAGQAPNKRQSQPGLPIPIVQPKDGEEAGLKASPGGVAATEDVYLATWDCLADAPNELSFSSGDRILVISREYEQFGWWVGQLLPTDGRSQNDAGGVAQRVGLVPKEYLKKE